MQFLNFELQPKVAYLCRKPKNLTTSMKKLTILALFAIAASVFMVSCSGGDDDTTTKPKPTITWKTNAGYTFQNVSVSADSTIDFGVLATSASGEKISKLAVTVSVNGGPAGVLWDTTLSSTSISKDWMDVGVGSLAGAKMQITAVVTQADGETSSVSFVVTVTPSSGGSTISVRPNIEMGAQDNSLLGSFFDFELQEVNKLNVANSAPQNVDFIYYYGNTNKATFSAADDAQITQIFSSVSSWSVKNPSRFRKSSMTVAQFDALTQGQPATEINNQATTGTFGTKVTDLKVNDIIVFQTAGANDFGLMKVTELTAGTNNKIKFDLKIAN